MDLLSLTGLIIAQIFQHSKSGINLKSTLIYSLLIVALGVIITFMEPAERNANFYRLAIGGTLQHIGIAILWMVAFVFASQKFPTNKLFSFLEWLSQHITIIYLLQWIVIMWLLPFAGYHQLNFIKSVIAILITSSISFGLPYLVQRQFFKKASPANHTNTLQHLLNSRTPGS